MGKALVIIGADFSADAIDTNRVGISYNLTDCETSIAPTAVALGLGVEIQ